MKIADTTEVQYAAARESDTDPGELAVYGGRWTTVREVAENLVKFANTDFPGLARAFELWTRTVTIAGVGPADADALPADRWGFARVEAGGDIDYGTRWAKFRIQADTGWEAIIRVFKVLAHDYQDKIDPTSAYPSPDMEAGDWVVRVRMVP